MKRILTKETILIVLFLFSACLIMLGVFYYDMSNELDIIENNSINKLKNEYKIAAIKFESMAKILYSQLDGQDDIKKILYLSSKEDNLIKKNFLRERLITAATPFFNDIRRHEFYDMKFHFKDGTNFVRMRHKEKFGDKIDYRKTVTEANRQKNFHLVWKVEDSTIPTDMFFRYFIMKIILE